MRAAVACLLTASLLLHACAAQPKKQSTPDPTAPADAGLEALAANPAPVFLPPPRPAASTEDSLARKAEEAALNLERLLASGALDRQPTAGPTPEPTAPQDELELFGPFPEVIAQEPQPEPAPPADPLVELAQRMAALLRDPGEGRAPIPHGVALAPIESMQPGILADLESSTNTLGPKLSQEDRDTLIKARDHILAHPSQSNETLARALSKLAPPAALKIAHAALCTRVTGFGNYEPFPTTAFVYGRPLRAIVYVEIDGFASRPARTGDPAPTGAPISEQVTVDLTQALTLYQDKSGLLSWHRPARPVMETGRNKRRDFYIIQQIELPATLSIGRYNLKVIIKDKTTGAEAEAILPISIVADRSAIK